LVFASLAALIAGSSFISAHADPEYRGRVTKQGGRVARPSFEDQPVYDLKGGVPKNAPIQANVRDDAFVLRADTVTGAASSESWNPWAGLSSQQGHKPLNAAAVASNSEVPLQVDYEAIEKAYEEAVPRALPPAMPTHIAPGTTMDANAQAIAAGNAAAAQNYYLRQQQQQQQQPRGGGGGCPRAQMNGNSAPAGGAAGVANPTVVRPGLANAGVATPGVATSGVATPGLATPGLATPGIATSGVAQAGVGTPGVATPGIAVSGVRTAGVAIPGAIMGVGR
jgi:hypothetical protein